MGDKKCRTLEPTKQFFICTEKAYHEIKSGLSNNMPLVDCPVCGVKIDYKKSPILSDLYDKSIRNPEANPLFSDFLDQVMEALSIERNIPIEILKMKFSPDYVKWIGAKRASIDPVKEADCENCDHPAECDECLAEFNARITRKELSVAAKVFTDNVKLSTENDALKKLFIAEHKEKSELLNSNGLLKSREDNLLKKIKELEASNG